MNETDKDISNTRVASGKIKNSQNKHVSEFNVYGSEELVSQTGRTSSYFKNKNAVTTINRTD